MTASDRGTILASFDDSGKAEVALDRLWHAGFRREQIGVVLPGRGVAEAQTGAGVVEAAAAQGAVAGAATGGTIGGITGALLTAFVPGLGPVLAGGILAGIVGGAAAGAAGGVYLGPFIAMGLSEDEARSYEGKIQAGQTIIAVRGDTRLLEAADILERYGAHSIRHCAGEPAACAR